MNTNQDSAPRQPPRPAPPSRPGPPPVPAAAPPKRVLLGVLAGVAAALVLLCKLAPDRKREGAPSAAKPGPAAAATGAKAVAPAAKPARSAAAKTEAPAAPPKKQPGPLTPETVAELLLPAKGQPAPKPPAKGPDTGLTDADIRAANALVTSKEARAPYQKIQVGGQMMALIDPIDLHQDRALPEDLYVYLMLKCHFATGKLPPPTVVEKGAEDILRRYNPNELPQWKLDAVRRFWGGHASTQFAAADLANKDNVNRQFVVYLSDKQYVVNDLRLARQGALVASLEQWNKVVQGWREHEARVQQAEAVTRGAREGYLAAWDVDWAVGKAVEAIERNR